MSLEPNARSRLRLVCASTRDLDLKTHLSQALEEDSMSYVPSAELLREIALCATCTQDAPRTGRAGLCDRHRARWNLEACMVSTATAADGEESLHGLVKTLLSQEDAGAQLLTAFDRQRRALRLVWEAHARGAVHLPESVAASVERARESEPRFLSAGSRSRVQQAS